MDNVIAFAPRQRPPEPMALAPLSGLALRASLEEAAQTALDAADRIIAVLDRIDGDVTLEPDADAKPSLAAPESRHGDRVVAMRGDDREAEAPEISLPDVALEETTESAYEVIPNPPLRWSGSGNVIAAAGVVLVDLVAR